MLVNVVSHLDRYLVGILAEPIKRDLAISDQQLALGVGVSFAIVYALAAVPLARLADRGLSRGVILGSVATWCAMTTMVGLARSFPMFVLARAGVAIGEAGVLPAGQAIISRRFPVHRRGKAIGLLWVGASVGAALAPLLGGYVAVHYGWREAFWLIGPLGLLSLPLIFWALRPERAGQPSATATPSVAWPVAIKNLFARPSYALLWVGSAFAAMPSMSYMLYVGSFFSRTFGTPLDRLGAQLGLIYLCSGTAAMLLGGWLFDATFRRHPSLGMVVPIASQAAAVVLGVAAWHAATEHEALFFFGGAFFMLSMLVPAGYTMAQHLAPADAKATSAGIFNLAIGLVGASIGPFVVGSVSDALSSDYGRGSLAIGLTLLAVPQALSIFFFLFVLLAERRRATVPSEPSGIA